MKRKIILIFIHTNIIVKENEKKTLIESRERERERKMELFHLKFGGRYK